MKNIFKGMLALVCLSALTLGVCTSCSDDDFTPGPRAEGAGIHFSSAQTADIELKEVQGTFNIELCRSNASGAIEAELTVSLGEGATDLFTVPTKVSFPEGASKASLAISYKNLQRDVEYQLTIAAKEGTPYGVSSQTFTVVCPLVWTVISENAILVDNLFEPFGGAGIQLDGIKLEKHPEKNIYRFLSPYTNDYLNALFEIQVVPNGFVNPYILLDGEKYPGHYYVPMVSTGWKMVNGEGPKGDPEWKTFGSMYGNLSDNQAKFPLGSYDEAKKIFDLGALVHNIADAGGPIQYPIKNKTLLIVNN